MFLKVGHRGARAYKPENTLSSFRKAIDLGVDMVEFDVHVCRSGGLVVIHDEKVNRTTNGKGHVSGKTLQELKLLDAGGGEKIPTLEDALDAIARKCKVDIELKGKGSAKPAFDTIKKYVSSRGWEYEDFLITSFKKSELEEFQKHNAKTPVGVLYEKIPKNFADYALKIGASAVALPYKKTTQQHIREAHEKNLKVLVWTVNSRTAIKKLERMGVDAIASDYPDRLA